MNIMKSIKYKIAFIVQEVIENQLNNMVNLLIPNHIYIEKDQWILKAMTCLQ